MQKKGNNVLLKLAKWGFLSDYFIAKAFAMEVDVAKLAEVRDTHALVGVAGSGGVRGNLYEDGIAFYLSGTEQDAANIMWTSFKYDIKNRSRGPVLILIKCIILKHTLDPTRHPLTLHSFNFENCK